MLRRFIVHIFFTLGKNGLCFACAYLIPVPARHACKHQNVDIKQECEKPHGCKGKDSPAFLNKKRRAYARRLYIMQEPFLVSPFPKTCAVS